MTTLTIALILALWLAFVAPFYTVARRALYRHRHLRGKQLHNAAFVVAMLWPAALCLGLKRTLDVENS